MLNRYYGILDCHHFLYFANEFRSHWETKSDCLPIDMLLKQFFCRFCTLNTNQLIVFRMVCSQSGKVCLLLADIWFDSQFFEMVFIDFCDHFLIDCLTVFIAIKHLFTIQTLFSFNLIWKTITSFCVIFTTNHVNQWLTSYHNICQRVWFLCFSVNWRHFCLINNKINSNIYLFLNQNKHNLKLEYKSTKTCALY